MSEENNEIGLSPDDHGKFLRLKEIDDEVDQLKARETTLTQERAEIEEALVKAMDDATCPRIVLAGTTFYRRTDQYPKVKDQDGLVRWLSEIDRSDMVKPTVNAASLRSLVIERGKQNEALPHCLELFQKARVQTRATK